MRGLPYSDRVQASVLARIADLSLSGHSDITRVPHIGKFLASRIGLAVGGTLDATSVKEVLAFLYDAIAQLQSRDARRSRLQLLLQLMCQNKHPGQCAQLRQRQKPGVVAGARAKYLVRDVNKGCALALPMTLAALLRRHPDTIAPPGTGAEALQELLGGLDDASAAPQNRQSSELLPGVYAAASCPCQRDMASCALLNPACHWDQGAAVCSPAEDFTIGFEGVGRHSGQRLLQGELPRGEYTASASGLIQWRKPSELAVLPLPSS
jgi:hypothetical protein